MITLIGGKYDGQFLNRDPMPVGATVAIVDGGMFEQYTMQADGTAKITSPYAKMDSAAKKTDLCPQHEDPARQQHLPLHGP